MQRFARTSRDSAPPPLRMAAIQKCEAAAPHLHRSAFLKVFRRGPRRDASHRVVVVHVDKPRKDEAAGA
jgi:hypothetical protein